MRRDNPKRTTPAGAGAKLGEVGNELQNAATSTFPNAPTLAGVEQCVGLAPQTEAEANAGTNVTPAGTLGLLPAPAAARWP